MASSTPSTNAELEALLARIALGDQRAFEQLYRATSGHLLGVAYGVMRDRQRAEDALQEGYLNVWHAAGSFKGQLATPMTWLINIVRNKAIDRQRVGGWMRSTQVTVEDEALQLPAEAEREPEQLVHTAFVRAHIDACMDGLAAGQRQALALAFFRGLVHAEIAETMGAPLGTVKAWVRRGSDRLRDCLNAAGVRGAS